jgi:phosphopantothenoylcysteine synthetase/decarboxylase
MLEGKVIYVVTTGANKSKDVKILLDYLKAEGARCILMPTATSCSIMDLKNVDDYQIRKDYTFNRADSINERVPEEDIIVVAPCTFNTFSKIANGIADNYPLSIIHAAIGYGKYIVIAPSMNQGYFNHPITKGNFAKINSFGNVSIVYPEYIYKDDGTLDRITMAPWGKILDTVCHKYTKIRYTDKKVNYDMTDIINEHFPDFFQ